MAPFPRSVGRPRTHVTFIGADLACISCALLNRSVAAHFSQWSQLREQTSNKVAERNKVEAHSVDIVSCD